MDTLGHLLALHTPPATEQDRTQVVRLAEAVQVVTGQHDEVACVDQGYIGEPAAQAAQAQGVQLQVIKLSEPRQGFVLMPRRWIIERSFGWMARFRRLARDYERLRTTLEGWH